MAMARNLGVNDITIFLSPGRGPLDVVIVARVQCELRKVNFNPAGGRVVSQVKAVDDRGRFRWMHVNMNHFVQPVERARLEEGFQSAIGRHGLMMGLLDGSILVSSSDTEMPTGGGVPPEH